MGVVVIENLGPHQWGLVVARSSLIQGRPPGRATFCGIHNKLCQRFIFQYFHQSLEGAFFTEPKNISGGGSLQSSL